MPLRRGRAPTDGNPVKREGKVVWETRRAAFKKRMRAVMPHRLDEQGNENVNDIPDSVYFWHRKFCLCSPISLPKFLVPKLQYEGTRPAVGCGAGRVLGIGNLRPTLCLSRR